MRCGLVAIAALAWLGTACDTREQAALKREEERLRTKRDDYARVAASLDDYTREVTELSEAMAKIEQMGVLLDHAKRVDRAAAVPGVTRTSVGAGIGWELTGVTTDESFRQVREQAGSLGIDNVRVGVSGWTVRVSMYDYQASFGSPPGVQIPPPTPAPGRFPGRRSLKLRAEIEALQKEVAELERLVGDIDEFKRKRGELETYRKLLETPSRLTTTGDLAARLFIEGGAPCRAGSIALVRDTARVFCTPHVKDPEAGAEVLRAYFGSVRDWKLGPVSIDASNPEPVQGSLTHLP